MGKTLRRQQISECQAQLRHLQLLSTTIHGDTLKHVASAVTAAYSICLLSIKFQILTSTFMFPVIKLNTQLL